MVKPTVDSGQEFFDRWRARIEPVQERIDRDSGIMAPQVQSAEEAKHLVAAMRYPPDGMRGATSGCMACGFGADFDAYFPRANKELTGIAQIETREGFEAVDEIAAVEGIDVLFIGHSDLTLDLGCYGQFDHPDVTEAEDRVLNACRQHGKTAGMLLKASMDVSVCRRRGFTFLARGVDLSLLRDAIARSLQL